MEGAEQTNLMTTAFISVAISALGLLVLLGLVVFDCLRYRSRKPDEPPDNPRPTKPEVYRGPQKLPQNTNARPSNDACGVVEGKKR